MVSRSKETYCRQRIICIPNSTMEIDFYSTEILCEDGKNVWLDKHDDKYFIGQHKYSTKHPTLINVEKPHGVRNDNRDRVYLHMDVYEKFNSIKQRIKDGIFFTK